MTLTIQHYDSIVMSGQNKKKKTVDAQDRYRRKTVTSGVRKNLLRSKMVLRLQKQIENLELIDPYV